MPSSKNATWHRRWEIPPTHRVSRYEDLDPAPQVRLQVLPGARARPVARPADSRGKRALAHLLELCASRHLLGEQRGLDAVEQPLQPADQLRLGDAQLGV